MSKSKLFLNQITKLIEQGIYSYKDLSNEFISILRTKRDELIYKLKLTGSEETEVLNKRIENLEKKFKKFENQIKKKKIKKVKK
ncbi:hypothetical protein N9U62_00635 [Candidatus Pelagibacter sp.]|nr:hypothetical protein [Candidatus Pelagibacter sp.]|tara:strand:- start:980 stop:1231 length:252 start_codon:yes stop_codon:yes gene_type:complete